MMKQKQRKKPGRDWLDPARREAGPGTEAAPVKPAADEQAAVPRLADRPVKDGQPASRDAAHDERPVKPGADSRAHGPATGGDGPAEYPDQQPPAAAPQGPAAAEPDGEQYVRLRVRVRENRLSVVDSHLVDGPLAQATAFPGTNAYEVTLDGRLLHAGALPDLGVQRSFPNPGGPEAQRGHHLTERAIYEFSARVPASELTPETIGRVRVTLHRVTQEARVSHLSQEPLARQFEEQMQPVAELAGLPDSALPAAIDARGGRTPSV